MRTLLIVSVLLCVIPAAWAGQYAVEPFLVSDGVVLDEAAFAWAPDGLRAGWIDDGMVVIYDTVVKKQVARTRGGYSALLWDDSGLYAIRGSGEKTAVSVIDPDSGRVAREIPVGVSASRLYRSARDGELILGWQAFKREKIGIDVNYALYVLDLKTGKLDKKYSDYHIGFGRNVDARFYRGWAGVSGLDTQALLVDYISPPALRSYMRFVLVDYLQNTKNDIGRTEALELTSRASWNSDGRRVALALEGDGIAFLDIKDGKLSVLEGFSGLWPSWSPSGDKLYFGGFLISPDGTRKEEILNNAGRTIGWWSPDGTRLAVADANSSIRLITGFAPSASGVKPGTRQRLLDLKGLLIDGLISQDEFNTRRDRLLDGAGR